MKKVEEPQLIKLKLLYIAAATIAFAHKSVRKYRWLQSETARGPRYTHTLPRRKCYHDHAGNSCVRLRKKNEIVIKLKKYIVTLQFVKIFKMSASARIVAILLMISATTAVPAGETRRTLTNGTFIYIYNLLLTKKNFNDKYANSAYTYTFIETITLTENLQNVNVGLNYRSTTFVWAE